VQDIMLAKSDVVIAKSTDLINDVYKVLAEKNVLSVPVQNEEGKIYGFLDEIDILYFAVENNDLLHGTCAQVMNYSKLNPYVTIQRNMNLIKLCEQFCITHFNLHRIAVVDENDEFVGIITQSKIVRYFAPHVKHFDFGNSSVEVLNLGGRRKVTTINGDDTISKAIQLLYDNKVSSAAIVDADNKLIGNFSASDLKLFSPRLTADEMIKVTIVDFMKNIKGSKDHHNIFFVHNYSLCHQIVAKLDSQKSHRTYVVDADHHPVGIILLADILELFWRHLVID
jgi:CBS domain-containing protein